MSKVNVSLQEVFTSPGNVLVTVKAVLVGSQNVVVGTKGILPGQVSKRTNGSGYAQFDLVTGRYQVMAASGTLGSVAYQPFIDVPDDDATYEHTQLIVSGASPFSQPVAVARERLVEIASAEGYELTATNFDSDGVVTTATVKWPDGSAGVFTTTLKNGTFLTVDAYTITHAVSGKTVTQAAVTRDVNGNVTVKPALTVT